jgi:hypothetical protein
VITKKALTIMHPIEVAQKNIKLSLSIPLINGMIANNKVLNVSMVKNKFVLFFIFLLF